MTKVTRKRCLAAQLEDVSDIIHKCSKAGWTERELKIMERTRWDLKQMAKTIRLRQPSKNPSRAVETNRARAKKLSLPERLADHAAKQAEREQRETLDRFLSRLRGATSGSKDAGQDSPGATRTMTLTVRG